MLDVATVRSEIMANLDILEFEVATLWKAMIDNDWFSGYHHFPNMTHGLMMTCFARIDLYSRYWRGTDKAQTKRMYDFLDRFMYRSQCEENRVAIKMWRHALMHTSEPRRVRDKRSGIEYMWLLHLSDWLPRDQHYTFSVGGDGTKVLNIGVLYFVEDLKRGADTYLANLTTDPLLQANYEAAEPSIILQEL